MAQRRQNVHQNGRTVIRVNHTIPAQSWTDNIDLTEQLAPGSTPWLKLIVGACVGMAAMLLALVLLATGAYVVYSNNNCVAKPTQSTPAVVAPAPTPQTVPAPTPGPAPRAKEIAPQQSQPRVVFFGCESIPNLSPRELARFRNKCERGTFE